MQGRTLLSSILLIGLIGVWASSLLMVRAGLTPFSRGRSYAGLMIATILGCAFGVSQVVSQHGFIASLLARGTLQSWIAVIAPGAITASLWGILLYWMWSVRCFYRLARGSTTVRQITHEILRALRGERG